MSDQVVMFLIPMFPPPHGNEVSAIVTIAPTESLYIVLTLLIMLTVQ